MSTAREFKEPELVSVPADVNTWWTKYGRWMNNRVWCPRQGQHHSASPGESRGPRKPLEKLQDCPLPRWKQQVKLFPFELKVTLTLDLSLVAHQDSIAIKLCGFIPQVASSNLSRKVEVTLTLLPLAQTFAKSPNVLDGLQTTIVWPGVLQLHAWLSCPIPQTICGWIQTLDSHGQVTGPGFTAAKIKLQASCTSCSAIFSALWLTGAHGKWRCSGNNSNSSKGDGILQTLGTTGSVLTLSVNHIGLFVSCGNQVYNGFPANCSGQCGLGYLAPSVTRYSTLNAGQIANLGSFVPKIGHINVPVQKS